ncbi:MAG: YceI family protein [Cyclobacteriaceae bacterium]
MKKFSWIFSAFILTLMLVSFTEPIKGTSYNVDNDKSKLVWTGRKIGGEHSGTIKIKVGNLEMEGNKLSGGSFIIDMSSIVNEDLSGEYKAKLEGHLKSDDFFGVANHPTAQLLITQVKGGKDGKYDITGNLTIKGITHAVNFPATVNASGNQVKAEAKIVVDRSKFDVRYGSNSFFDNLGDKAIYDDFDLEVSLIANTAVGK